MRGTSKAFRARIELGEDYARRIQEWVADHFALSAVFSSGKATVLVALTDRARSAASFARTLRGALKALAVPTSTRTLRGHWVSLLSEKEALLICTGSNDLAPTAPPPPAGPMPGLHSDEVRTIALG